VDHTWNNIQSPRIIHAKFEIHYTITDKDLWKGEFFQDDNFSFIFTQGGSLGLLGWKYQWIKTKGKTDNDIFFLCFYPLFLGVILPGNAGNTVAHSGWLEL